jgi:radical SAM superfamily enzyme YgiQ (UPF0313 family)
VTQRWLLIDTTPRAFPRNKTINPGLEIVARALKAPVAHWTEEVDLSGFDVVGFNIYYPLHLLNVQPFLERQGIEEASSRRVRLVAGGQGVSNLQGVERAVFDEIFRGEFDGDREDRHGFRRASSVSSDPIVKHGRAIVEMTRGCRYRCAFCEYGHRLGGDYREKPIEQAIEQLEEVQRQRVSGVNLFSMNLAGYSDIEELLAFANSRRIRILNTDSCIAEIRKLDPIIGRMNGARIGVESFHERTRLANGKRVNDEELFETIRWLSERVGHLYLYLIWGLPGDDYESWLLALEKLSQIRRDLIVEEPTLFGSEAHPSKLLRVDFSITPFEPSVGTPHEGAEWVDFAERRRFRRKWVREMSRLGFLKRDYEDAEKAPGRWGRAEPSYRLLMNLKTRGPEIWPALARIFARGTGVSVDRRKCERFLEEVGG